MLEARLPYTPASLARAETVSSAFTRYGALVGTLAYMSPEQWLSETVDVRSDIWAAGIILYQLVVGRHPLPSLRGKQFAVVANLEEPMPSAHDAPVDIDPALADVIDTCLVKDKHGRMASAEALLEALYRRMSAWGPKSGSIDDGDCRPTNVYCLVERREAYRVRLKPPARDRQARGFYHYFVAMALFARDLVPLAVSLLVLTWLILHH